MLINTTKRIMYNKVTITNPQNELLRRAFKIRPMVILKKIKVKIERRKRTKPKAPQAIPLEAATDVSIFTSLNFTEA